MASTDQPIRRACVHKRGHVKDVGRHGKQEMFNLCKASVARLQSEHHINRAFTLRSGKA